MCIRDRNRSYIDAAEKFVSYLVENINLLGLLLNNIDFPISLTHIQIFEKINNDSINVYGVENDITTVSYTHLDVYKRQIHFPVRVIYISKVN